jgi:hypothetical protein
MTLMLTYWKQFAMLALFLAGVYLGYSYEHAKFETFVAQVETQAKVAEALNAEKQRRQETISNEITKGYSDAVKKLKAHYVGVSHNTPTRVHNPKTSGSEVPNIPTTTAGVDAEAESSVPNSRGNTLIEDCSADVLQLLFLQQWVEEQSK